MSRPTRDQLHKALRRLCDAIGETPHTWPDQATYRAYCDAVDLLDGPDLFTANFQAKASQP